MSKLDELIYELCPDGVEYYKLSQLFETKNGYTPSKKIASIGQMEQFLGFAWRI